MKMANQLPFTTCQASLKLKANNLTRSIFDNVDWPFIHPLGRDGYLLKGRDLRPYFTIKAQPLFYLASLNQSPPRRLPIRDPPLLHLSIIS